MKFTEILSLISNPSVVKGLKEKQMLTLVNGK